MYICRQLKNDVTMKKILLTVVLAMMATVSMDAQRIQVLDDEGNSLTMACILDEEGVMIGITDLDGVVKDVKGAAKVTVTHVAFKPQQATIAGLRDGIIRMEAEEYGLPEIVVKPKPLFYVEYYFRAFSYINDSLRVYTAGIIPVGHNIQKNYKGKIHGVWSFGGAANKALVWNTQDLELKAEKGVKSNATPIEKTLKTGKKFREYYKTEIVPNGKNQWIVRNPEEVVGNIVHDDGISRVTLDGGRMQIFANKAKGENKMAKIREKKNYEYQYAEVFKLDEDGTVGNDGFVMRQHHWQYDTKEGKKTTILYYYATDKCYKDESEFKARSKELNKGYNGDMSLKKLAAYEQAHNIPALAPELQKAIQKMKLRTGK